MSVQILKLIEIIHRERHIPIEIIFRGIESAIRSACRDTYPDHQVTIDRKSGQIQLINHEGQNISSEKLGRLEACIGKRAILHEIDKAEADVLFQEFLSKRWTIMTGSVHSFAPNQGIMIQLGRAKGYLPPEEQIPWERLRLGDTIQVYVLKVFRRRVGIHILLSRTTPFFIRRLLEVEVPEISQGVVEVKALARIAGRRAKIAVFSQDEKVDPVGACIGIRSTRIHNILEQLPGEKIDIIRWEPDLKKLIPNALQPAVIKEIILDYQNQKAAVIVSPDQHALAIGREGENVKLASKICQCEIDIATSWEELRERQAALQALSQPPTTNLQPPTTNLQPPTTNLQPPTTNLQPHDE